jgi:hypothetical protein
MKTETCSVPGCDALTVWRQPLLCERHTYWLPKLEFDDELANYAIKLALDRSQAEVL